ncbi:MAG: HNH endonuclease, partial [Thaumarchaeota archaeon]|nr:HNH endonuclease [Nitrososphaerota archaeon]
EYYSEAHHLIPLGEDGADNVSNIVILSPLIHRMLHYAKVDGLDLNKIKNNKLLIKINGVKHVITWHRDHAKTIK